MKMHLSIVIPVYNESESLKKLCSEVLNELNKRKNINFELIFVDDGSTDDSLSILNSLARNNSKITVIELSRNFGQTAAMYAGFQNTKGNVVIPLDADGQNVPNDIYRLYDELIDGGYDCVSGWRFDRRDKGITRKLPSYIANRMLASATGVLIHDSGCTLKAYSGDLLRSIPLYGEMHRLIPFYVYLSGGKISELKVGHRSREFGKSKYGLSRTFRVLQDIVVARVQYSFSRRPMHLFGNIALGSTFVGLSLLLASIFLKIFGIKDFVETPLLVLSTIFILAAVQILTSGLIAEMLVRQFSFQGGNPTYRIRKISSG